MEEEKVVDLKNEKKNNTLIIIIVVLSILVLAMGAFIINEKVLSKKSGEKEFEERKTGDNQDKDDKKGNGDVKDKDETVENISFNNASLKEIVSILEKKKSSITSIVYEWSSSDGEIGPTKTKTKNETDFDELLRALKTLDSVNFEKIKLEGHGCGGHYNLRVYINESLILGTCGEASLILSQEESEYLVKSANAFEEFNKFVENKIKDQTLNES